MCSKVRGSCPNVRGDQLERLNLAGQGVADGSRESGRGVYGCRRHAVGALAAVGGEADAFAHLLEMREGLLRELLVRAGDASPASRGGG